MSYRGPTIDEYAAVLADNMGALTEEDVERLAVLLADIPEAYIVSTNDQSRSRAD